jgi:hypothetical protein
VSKRRAAAAKALEADAKALYRECSLSPGILWLLFRSLRATRARRDNAATKK